MKKSSLFILLIVIGLCPSGSAGSENIPSLTGLNPQLKFSGTKYMGGEVLRGELIITRNESNRSAEYEFVLQSDDAHSIVKPPAIVFKPGADRASFEFKGSSTPIIKTTRIQASLTGNSQVSASLDVQLVPALLQRVDLTGSPLIATFGSKIMCRVELKAPAPVGGIQLYLSQPFPDLGNKSLSSTSWNISNPRVPAGRSTIEFAVNYDDMVFDSPYNQALFNLRKVTFSFYVSLQSQSRWQPIPDIAQKAEFNFEGLKVVSMSMSPNPIRAGAEALGTLTLNAPAGNGEKARMRGGTKEFFWTAPLGSGCLETGNVPEYELPLTPGQSTHQFKFCTRNLHLNVNEVLTERDYGTTMVLRSGLYSFSGFRILRN